MNDTHEAKKIRALSALVDVIMDAVRASGSTGIPEGHLYVALQSIPNFRVEHLNQILDAMVAAGKVTRKNFLVKVP